jgi:uncharacterized membrane protein
MKNLSRTFLTGLVATVPLIITVYVLYWLGTTAERLLGSVFKTFLSDEVYWPGMGLILAIILIFFTGLLLQAIIFQHVFNWFEKLLIRLPLVKTFYNSVRDLIHFLSGAKEKQFSRVVMVTLPQTDFQMLGFVTREQTDHPGTPFGDLDTIAVYLPLSYQIGGFTLLLPRTQVQPIEMSAVEAMRFVITAGIGKA